MKTQNENSVFWKKFWRTFAILEGIVIIILLFCNTNLKNSNRILKAEVASLKDDYFSLESRMSILLVDISNLKKENSELKNKLSSLNSENAELSKQSLLLKKEISMLYSERNYFRSAIVELSNLVEELNGKVNSIEYPEVESIEKDSILKEEIAEKEVSVKIEKTSYNKKNKETKTALLNYSAPISFSSLTGFSKDSLNYLYNYINENSDSVKLNFHSFIEKEKVSLNILQNNLVLFSEDKKIMDAGGLLTEVELSWNSDIFLEKTFDKTRWRRGNREILFGIPLMVLGGAGYYYFNNYPDNILNIYRGDKLIFQKKSYNDFGKLISATAGISGAFLVGKGLLDKKLSYSISPARISLNYILE